MSPLTELASLLAPGNAAIAKRVALAIEDPRAYANKFASDLEDWNVEDEPVDPWFALVSGLAHDRAQLACSIDWKFPAEDIHANLGWVIAAQRKLRSDTRLYDAKKLFAFYDEDAHLLTKTIDFIRLCGRAFSAHGLALIELGPGDGDSYVLTMVPWKDLPKAQALAKKARERILSHAPKGPLKAPLPTPPPKAKGKVKLDKLRFEDVRERHFAHTPGFLVTPDEKAAALVDCRTWPPKSTKVGAVLDVVVHERSGARIAWWVRWDVEDGERVARPTGTLQIGAVELLERLPDEFDIDHAGWIGDLAVLLPTEPTIRGKKSRRPLVWNGKTLAPAKGLPDAKPAKPTRRVPFPSFVRRGWARTGDGQDVLIWEGAGWVAKGERFVKTWKLHAELAIYEMHEGAPAPGKGFFYAHRRGPIATLRHADGRACTERLRFEGVIDGPLRAAPDGRIVFSLNRYAKPKSPVLGVFHPESNELTFVPPELLAVRRDDHATAYGVSAPKKGDPFLWILDREELRRLPWSAILALPRRAQ